MKVQCFYCGESEHIDEKDWILGKDPKTHVCDKCSDKMTTEILNDIFDTQLGDDK